MTFSFLSAKAAALFGGAKPELTLVNPISSDLDVMRPSVLPNLVEAARRNADRGFPDVALFEFGPLYRDDRPEGQMTVAAGLRAGRLGPRDWREKPREPDLYDAKADALAALAAAGAPADNLQTAADPPPWYHPGRAGILRLGATVLGHFGELHPDVLEAFDAKGPVAAFEVFLDAVPLPRARERPAAAAAVGVPAGRARFRVYRRSRPAGRDAAARRARRRPQARQRHPPVRRLRRQGVARGQEIAGDRGHACSRRKRR